MLKLIKGSLQKKWFLKHWTGAARSGDRLKVVVAEGRTSKMCHFQRASGFCELWRVPLCNDRLQQGGVATGGFSAELINR